jgi:pimeloyl-ACP methyl ester carboxylesterase
MSARPIEGLTSAFADVGGERVHYRIGGDPAGRPVLLWHGFLGTSYVWRHVAPRLVEAGWSVLAPDMRGYGDSAKPPGVEGYDGRALAEGMRRLVAQIGFGAGRPLTIVAHDMGAPPALLWAAGHPAEVERLFYLEEPVVLQRVIARILAFEPASMQRGSLWWWILPLAPNAPERLIVGNERAFLAWFYDRDPSTRRAVDSFAIDEYIRTFAGHEGVLGALGVYRATFVTMEQTEALLADPVEVPIVALGGERALGARVGEMLGLVARYVESDTVPDVGHFLPEEAPDEIIHRVLEAS